MRESSVYGHVYVRQNKMTELRAWISLHPCPVSNVVLVLACTSLFMIRVCMYMEMRDVCVGPIRGLFPGKGSVEGLWD